MGRHRTDLSTDQSACKPRVMLDICLARASSVHERLDKLSGTYKVSGRRESDQQEVTQTGNPKAMLGRDPSRLSARLSRDDDTAFLQLARNWNNGPAQHTGPPDSLASLQVNEMWQIIRHNIHP